MLALAIVLAMLGTSHLASLAAQRGSEEAATVINIAGRQRMLSQRILFFASRHRAYEAESRVFADGPLLESVRQFEASHTALSRGGSMGLSERGAAGRAQVYFDGERGETLDAATRAFVADTYEVLEDGPQANLAWLRMLSRGPNELLEGLNEAALVFETSARRRAAGVRLIAHLSFAAALLVLLIEALFIFLPAQRAVVQAIRDAGDARDHAEAARQRLERFVKHMSHELRTPLNGVIGMLTLMSSRSEADDIDEMVGEASVAADHLLGIVNDVLDLSKLQAGRMTLAREAYGPREAASACLSIFRAQARRRGLELTLEVGPDVGDAVEGDATRVRQVLANLLGNAVKFAGHGTVRVRVERLDRPSGPVLRYSVEDDGPGIDPADLDRLFEPFEQAACPATTPVVGTGLGLPICRQLVELMGGTLHAESGIGRGTRFWFDLPHLPAEPAEPAGAAPADAEPTAPPSRNLSVLVADDNRLNRLVARKYLEKLGHSVAEAEDGTTAVGTARQTRFDVILMDIQMPVLDGMRATRDLKSEGGRSEGCAILAVTANATSDDRATYEAAGFDGYLPKPFTMPALASAMAAAADAGPARAVAAE